MVKDPDGIPLPGATVMLKGVSQGTTTDFDGKFELKVNQPSGTLVISFIGYKILEVPFRIGTSVSVTLQEDVNSLDEVVVTALGIKREEKQLGYAQQTIQAESMTHARANNWGEALRGKVAGLNIVTSGSGPMNSQQITLRGERSLGANGNAALIVVDGIPVYSGLTSSGNNNAYMEEDVPVDYGNGIVDINPEDIESVTVLKGAGATALYGSRAANGAIMITTKSGKVEKGLGVTFSSNASVDIIQEWPEWQYEYGQGTMARNSDGELYYSYGVTEDGASTSGTSSAFGPKFDGQYYYQYDPILEGRSQDRTLWKPYKNNRKDFWRTGTTYTNNVSIEGGDSKGNMRASFTHSKNEWIMPNTGFERLAVSLKGSYQVSDRIRLNSVVNYTNRTSDNLPGTGYNNHSINYFEIFQNPNVDLEWYRPIWKEGRYQVSQIKPFSSYIENPYLIAYEVLNGINSNGVTGTLSANIKLSDYFDFMVRTGLNTNHQDREQKRPFDTNRFGRGYYKKQNIYAQETNVDFLLTYKNAFGDFDLSTSVGGNAMDFRYRRLDAATEDGLVVPGIYKLSNGISPASVRSLDSNKKVNSLYGMISWAYQNSIFLDLTARNDWSSTLPQDNWSFFYPSANASIVLSELLQFPKSIDYAKLRFSVAQVGNDTQPYRTSKYYSQSDFPSSATAPSTMHNINFKPEITTSYEAGMEYRLFGNRLGFDAAVYRTFTENQILEVPLNWVTGYSRAILNAGKVRNQGVELMVNGTPVKTSSFSWQTTVTWARNYNKILELAEALEGEDQQILGNGGSATLIAKVGGSTGDIYGYGFVRNEEGQILYNSKGMPIQPSEISYQGSAYADWKAGWVNTFTYKNLKLNVTLDGQYGGIVYSQTFHKASEQGKLKHTLYGREDGYIIGDGVVANSDGTFSPNTTKVGVPQYYKEYYRRANVESNSFDASFIKLREISLTYSIPRQLISKTGFRNANVSFYGRNLAVISDFPIYDPESAALNGDTLLPGIEMGQLPSPATYGMSLKVEF